MEGIREFYCYVLDYVLPKFICWNPDPQCYFDVTLFGDRVFSEVIKQNQVVKKTLIQDDKYPYKNEKCWTETHTEEDKVKELREKVTGNLSFQKKGLEQILFVRHNQLCQHLDCGLVASRPVRK